MPLAVKSLPHTDARDDQVVVPADERLAQFVRGEIDKALRDVDRRKRIAEADLEQRARRASKRIVSSGQRLERSLRHPPMPVLPVAIGAALIGVAILISRRR